MPLDVICAGWGRTGTLSLKVALEELLGEPCYHMEEALKHQDHDVLWLQAKEDVAAGRHPDLDYILSGYRAVTDWPAASFWKQLLQDNPQAKVVLTVRDPDKWYESMKETVWAMTQVLNQLPWYVLRLFSFQAGFHLHHHLAMMRALVWEGDDLQGCFISNPKRVKQLYLEHIEEVKKVVPAHQLLVFRPSEGWGPLCTFLNIPSVPDKPFPHTNDRQEWMTRLQGVRRLHSSALSISRGLAAAAVAAAAAAVGLAVVAVHQFQWQPVLA